MEGLGGGLPEEEAHGPAGWDAQERPRALHPVQPGGPGMQPGRHRHALGYALGKRGPCLGSYACFDPDPDVQGQKMSRTNMRRGISGLELVAREVALAARCEVDNLTTFSLRSAACSYSFKPWCNPKRG